MGGATSRVAGDATAFGDRDMGWMLSIDTVWEDPADDQKPSTGRAPSGPT